ncbi:MAG: hypothetical protein DRP02_02295 [Candidatus Gerdarchaeota archaeon]|nr:MAG: hypothetical protein DRP02_02295 [Candidatus Gerdarchaeota archaeon]
MKPALNQPIRPMKITTTNKSCKKEKNFVLVLLFGLFFYFVSSPAEAFLFQQKLTWNDKGIEYTLDKKTQKDEIKNNEIRWEVWKKHYLMDKIEDASHKHDLEEEQRLTALLLDTQNYISNLQNGNLEIFVEVRSTVEVEIEQDEVHVTSYNPEERQTDSSPCFGAGGQNLCELYKKGVRPIALSQDLVAWVGGTYRLGEKITLESTDFPNDRRCNGEFVVLDTMNKRWKKRADIFFADPAMNLSCNAKIIRR